MVKSRCFWSAPRCAELTSSISCRGHTCDNYDHYYNNTDELNILLLPSGENFEGLEFISSLLTKKSITKPTSPLIEVVGGENAGDEHDNDDDGDDDDDGDQWLWDQTTVSERLDDDDEDLDLRQPKYGFNGKASGLFTTKLSEERKEITDLPDPDHTSYARRWRWKIEHESDKFDADHYLADWADEDGEINRLVTMEHETGGDPPSSWSSRWQRETLTVFTDDEIFALKNLPRREILLTSSRERRVALLSVLDVLLAAAYDARTTEGESTVESGWTVNKLSATCCCFVEFESVFDVVVSFVRRSLIFPLIRNWDLAMKCVDDVIETLLTFSTSEGSGRSGAKVAVVKQLLDVYKIFVVGDPRYILNDMYIVDMILWTQSSDFSQSKIAKLTSALQSTRERLRKKDVGLELEELEAAARLVEEEEEEDGNKEDDDDDDEDASESDDDDEDASESDSDESDGSEDSSSLVTLSDDYCDINEKLDETNQKIKNLTLN